MKEEGVLQHFAGRWHWSHLLLCQNANTEALPHYSSKTKYLAFSVLEARATLLSTHLLQSVSYFSFFNKTKYFALVLTSKNPVLSLPEKVGQHDFFLTTQTTWVASHTKQGQWNGCGRVEGIIMVLYWELPTLLTFHSASFQHASYEPELGRSQNPPDTA